VSITNVIAIDGPVASGKTVVGKALAQQLGFRFVDTGIMYRAITWYVIHRKVDPIDEISVAKIATNAKLEITPETEGRVLVNGNEATKHLKQADVEAAVSYVSRVPEVRSALVEQQRRMASEGRIVMVGRDIGTNVLKDADLKIFLYASKEERVRRRIEDARRSNPELTAANIKANIEQRDKIDSERTLAPLKAADDAVEFCTDGLSENQVVQAMIALVKGT
tara:strand:+ start:382 stop:1047 length:666 start_codon:yes stop_codon:yes gene_type:complete